MSPSAKWEYMKTVYDRYHLAKTDRAEKGRILDEFCKTYRCHRKHALRLLNGPRPADSRPPTIDRRLKPKKTLLRRRIYGTTRPGLLLKHQIPIKTDHWDVDRPGFMEVDLVSHSGDCADGLFAHTLNLTDVFTGWVERRCVLGKGQAGICQAIDDIRRELPFALLGLDSDNGSEFINDQLLRYCRTMPTIQFTRGRPYKKDDNAHIEQKNWTHVRKLLGYGRYDTHLAIAAINSLYRGELRMFQNMFQPSTRLLAKTRVGSKLKRQHDAPTAPLDRVARTAHRDRAKCARLIALRDGLDPFALSSKIDSELTRIWLLRTKAPRPAWFSPSPLSRPPFYPRKPLEGPPMEPAFKPILDRYERLQAKENAALAG